MSSGDQTIPAGTALAERMTARGVRTVFALGGAGHTHLLLPLEARDVRIVGTRHETGAVGAADGYARTTGGIGVAAIIAEQGLPNAVTPIITAQQFGSPVVVLVTRFPDSWVEADGEYVVDHHALFVPITKWVRTVPSPDKLVDYFETACRIATAGRPGPVVLVIPQDFLSTPIRASVPLALPRPAAPSCADPATVSEAARLIAAAERPVLLIDSGCTGPQAIAAIAALHDRFGLPVFGYGSARGLLAEDDDAVLPWPFGQIACQQADLLLVAGGRLNMWFGFGREPRFPGALKVVQIDAIAEAIGRNRPVTLGIVADPGAALTQLVDALEAADVPKSDRAWLQEALAPRRAAVAGLGGDAEGPIHALALIRAIEARRPADGPFVGDGADILNWSNAALRIKRPRGYMDHHPLGSMGIGLPLAIGAAAAERDEAEAVGRAPIRTTLLTGDGSLGFYLAELDTAAREALPLTVVVGNDAQWGTEIHGQTLMTGRNVNTRLALSDYAGAACGLGLAAWTVDTSDELVSALDAAYATSGPALVDVRIDRQAGSALKRDPRLSFLIFSDLAPPNR